MIENAASGESSRPLAGVRVLVLTSGHEALDARVYGREAESVRALGASVAVVGKLTQGTPGEVEVLRIAAPSSRLMRFLYQPWRCLWRARSFQPDIVHFHDAELLAILPLSRLLWPKAKFVYDVHEDFANLMLIRDWLPGSVRPLVRRLTDAGERSLARLAHGIVAVTPPLALKFPHRHKVAAFNFPTPDFFDQAGRSARSASLRRYDVIHLGTLSEPRARFLADVIDELNRRRPNLRCLIVGASPEILEVLRTRVGPNCELKGSIAHAEVARLLSDAKVGIDIHPWLQPHLEPALAVKVCEYMACGCAVVASSMPVLEDILARAVQPLAGIRTLRGGGAAQYAAEAADLLARVDACEDPGVELRRFALTHMNWANQAERIGTLYRSLLDGAPCVT